MYTQGLKNRRYVLFFRNSKIKWQIVQLYVETIMLQAMYQSSVQLLNTTLQKLPIWLVLQAKIADFSF